MNRYGLIFGQSNLGSVCREPLWLSAAGGLAVYGVSDQNGIVYGFGVKCLAFPQREHRMLPQLKLP